MDCDKNSTALGLAMLLAARTCQRLSVPLAFPSGLGWIGPTSNRLPADNRRGFPL